MARRRGARSNHRGNHNTSLSSHDRYRLLATWPHGGQSDLKTSDENRARAIARENSSRGATVEFQVHEGWGVYRTVDTYRQGNRT
ncbi:hypothetical protein [Streptomyces sp. NPDC046371]|uniref:hypothetical protein n=1 Tax=Streptomyces sp. NPDC046371 TaxID=3154916 RepID=UPI0033F55BAE